MVYFSLALPYFYQCEDEASSLLGEDSFLGICSPTKLPQSEPGGDFFLAREREWEGHLPLQAHDHGRRLFLCTRGRCVLRAHAWLTREAPLPLAVAMTGAEKATMTSQGAANTTGTIGSLRPCRHPLLGVRMLCIISTPLA